MKKLLFLLLLSIPLYADTYKTLLNPYTGKFDFVNNTVSTTTISELFTTSNNWTGLNTFCNKIRVSTGTSYSDYSKNNLLNETRITSQHLQYSTGTQAYIPTATTYVTLPSTPVFVGLSSITVCATICPTVLSGTRMIAQGYHDEWEFYWFSNTIRFGVRATSYTEATKAFSSTLANTTHTVVGTWSGAKITVYVDGSPGTAVTKTGTITQSGTWDLIIGNQNKTIPYAGFIDNFAIYNSTWNVEDAIDYHNNGNFMALKPGQVFPTSGRQISEGLKVLYDFEIGASTFTVYDRSGNGFNGTFSQALYGDSQVKSVAMYSDNTVLNVSDRLDLPTYPVSRDIKLGTRQDFVSLDNKQINFAVQGSTFATNRTHNFEVIGSTPNSRTFVITPSTGQYVNIFEQRMSNDSANLYVSSLGVVNIANNSVQVGSPTITGTIFISPATIGDRAIKITNLNTATTNVFELYQSNSNIPNFFIDQSGNVGAKSYLALMGGTLAGRPQNANCMWNSSTDLVFDSADGKNIAFNRSGVTKIQLNDTVTNLTNNIGLNYTYSGTPAESCSVNGNLLINGYFLAANANGLRFYTDDTTERFRLADNGALAIANTSPPTTSLFQIGGATMTVLANGYIGIGTTSPINQLYVVGKSSFTNDLACGTTIFTNTLDVTGYTKIRLPYGAFYSTTTQSCAVANTTQTITLDGALDNHGVAWDATGRITATYSGEYLVGFSAVPQGTKAKSLYVFPRINEANVANSNTIWKFAENNSAKVMTVFFNFDLNTGDKLSFVMYSDDTNSQILALPASTTPVAPAMPSIIITINKTGEIQ